MKKIILGLVLFIVIGCSSDSESDNNSSPSVTTLKLVKVVEIYYSNDDLYTTNITYKNGFVDIIEGIDKSGKKRKDEHIYIDGKLNKINHFKNLVPTGYRTYTYEGDVITSMLSFEDNIYFVHKYSYNSKGQVIKEEQFSDDKLDATNTFEYNADGNISKEIYGNNGSNSYEYDNNKSPLSLVYSNSVLKTYGASGCKNNIIDSDLEYTYNSKGYPIQVVEKYDGVIQSKTTYTYE